jgi:Leucine-rich repeat (LRR) protein
MKKSQNTSPFTSTSSVSMNSVDYKSLSDSDDNAKFKRNISKTNKNTDVEKVFQSNSKYPFVLEKDENFKTGKKMLIRGKDLIKLNESSFKANSEMFLTSMELSPDRQSCLDYRLERLPKNISLFKNVRELKLDTNDLKELPVQIGELTRLERLSLSNNHLKTLPDQAISKLTSLRSLHLSNNEFEAIPSSVISLKLLEFLDLTSNSIKSIDKNISKLGNSLKSLLLYDNMIEDMTNIQELKLLDSVWIGKNKIKCVPLSITNIKTLDWKNRYFTVILDNNPLTEPPISICRQGFDTIRNWYNEKSKKEKVNTVDEKKKNQEKKY